MEFLHPDLYITEIGGNPVLLGVGTGTGGFVGEAEKGPVDEISLITDYGQYTSKYGEDGGDLNVAVRAFYDNGGVRCYVVRVINSTGALKATGDLKNMQIDAKYFGSYANGMQANTTRYTVMLGTAQTITSASDNVTLASAALRKL